MSVSASGEAAGCRHDASWWPRLWMNRLRCSWRVMGSSFFGACSYRRTGVHFAGTCARASMNALIPLDLAAMHDAARRRVERIAPVQHREIVPHQKVAHLPAVAQGELRLGGVRPQPVEQRLA